MKIYSKDSLAKLKKPANFGQGVDLREHMRVIEATGSGKNARTVVEISSSDFADAWYERQRYEVLAGRDSEPLLYEPIYNIVRDPSLPRNVSVNQLGPAGVVFEEIFENGEVKFASVGESSFSVRIRHYGVGVEYNKDLVMFNETWNLGIVERQAGIAYNALLNHVHLSPIITFSYGADNSTAAAVMAGASLEELVLRTLEDAIVEAENDTTNPRPGPYWLLINPANRFLIERALTRVPQEGFTKQSSAMNMIQGIIAYNGWTGTRGIKAATTYSGVALNEAYLIDVSNKAEDFQSFFKQDLTLDRGDGDLSRFIVEQVVWDVYFGVYSNPVRAVEKIALPTTVS